ncbi:MAG: hypothetical protein ABUJ98_01470 [Hyphomicrobium sp.]
MRVAHPVGRTHHNLPNEAIQNRCSCEPVGQYQAELAEALVEAGVGTVGFVVATTAIAGIRAVEVLVRSLGLGSRGWQCGALVLLSVSLVRLRIHSLCGADVQYARRRHRRADGANGHGGGDH